MSADTQPYYVAKHLRWLADRLVMVYGESENLDYIQHTRSTAAALADTQTVVAIEAIDSGRLARAILSVGISTLDWHVSQIVSGEDNDATMLAGLIATNYTVD